MSRNVYHGVDAELGRVATASSFPAFLDATAAIYNGYHERNFPERAAGLVAEIQETQPDVVGLQEAVMVRTDAHADDSDRTYHCPAFGPEVLPIDAPSSLWASGLVLPHRPKSKARRSRPYEDFFDGRLKRLVGARYERDIKTFRYVF